MTNASGTQPFPEGPNFPRVFPDDFGHHFEGEPLVRIRKIDSTYVVRSEIDLDGVDPGSEQSNLSDRSGAAIFSLSATGTRGPGGHEVYNAYCLTWRDATRLLAHLLNNADLARLREPSAA